MLLAKMERQIACQITADLERAQLEDRFGSRQAPARTGDVHPILDQVPTSAFDNARGNR